MKRVFLFSTFLLCLHSVSAINFLLDDLSYSTTSDSTVAVVPYYGRYFFKDVIIPSSVTYEGKEYSVTSIGNEAFWECYGMKKISIPASVKSIGTRAFFHCYDVDSINVDAENPSYLSIDGVLFDKDTTSLIACPMGKVGTLVIPASVDSISYGVFYKCEKISGFEVDAENEYYTSVDSVLYNKDISELIVCPAKKSGVFAVPSSVTTIADLAFEYCADLTEIIIPETVTTIGNFAFKFCDFLSEITIPSSVVSMGNEAFSKCGNLKKVTLSSSLTSISKRAFEYCFSLDSIAIPSSVALIGDSVFCGCSSLTHVTIPSSVITIGDGAFIYCSELTDVTIPASVTLIDKGAFNGCTGITSIVIPSSVTEVRAHAFYGFHNLIEVSFPSSLTSIEDGVFGNTGLVSVEIPSSVTSINQGAFFYCENLEEVIIPSSVTSIGIEAFNNCRSLKNIEIPTSVDTICDYAFIFSGLTSIRIPASVKSIGSGAFALCDSLTSIYAYAETPIDLNLSNTFPVFEGIDSTKCILYVPVGSKSLYQANAEWGYFTRIVEDVIMDVEEVDLPAVEISYSVGGESLQIKGAEAQSSVSVYGVNGTLCMQREMAAGESLSIASLPNGEYIVKVVVNGAEYTAKFVK